MNPPICIRRYVGDYALLAGLAIWLRDQRAGKYAELVARGTISEQDAYRDEQARGAIARDWRAIAADATRTPDELSVPKRWRIAALEGAIAGGEARLAKLNERDEAWGEWRDLRDAIATLLHYETQSWTLLGLQAFNRAMRLRSPVAPESEAA